MQIRLQFTSENRVGGGARVRETFYVGKLRNEDVHAYSKTIKMNLLKQNPALSHSKSNESKQKWEKQLIFFF